MQSSLGVCILLPCAQWSLAAHRCLTPTCRASPCRALNPGHPGNLVTPRPSGVIFILFIYFLAASRVGTHYAAVCLFREKSYGLFWLRAMLAF
eukprot:jgi/Chrzof1/8813/Cz03g25150.t1